MFLESYDFDSKKKESFKDLFKKSIGKDKSWDDVFPKKSLKEAILFDMLNVIQLVQKNFVNRARTQERWLSKIPDWINQYDKNDILDDLKSLGFVDSIKPNKTFFDAVCILGSTKNSMSQRINYVEFLIKHGLKTNSIIFLAGERYLTENVDGTEIELSNIAKHLNIDDWKKLTETDLIEALYKESSLYDNKLVYHLIDTPARDLPRPTTQTTILELISWLNNNKDIQNILFISNQPHIKYQNAIISSLFKDYVVKIDFEVVGSAYSNVENLGPVIEGLGSYIWAAFPIALSKLNIKVKDPKVKKLLHKLYYKNPLIYNSLPKDLIIISDK